MPCISTIHQLGSFLESHGFQKLFIIDFSVLIFVALLDNLLHVLLSLDLVLVEDPLDLRFRDLPALVLVQLLENVLQVDLGLDQGTLQATGQKFTVVYLPVLISVDVVHHFLQLC